MTWSVCGAWGRPGSKPGEAGHSRQVECLGGAAAAQIPKHNSWEQGSGCCRLCLLLLALLQVSSPAPLLGAGLPSPGLPWTALQQMGDSGLLVSSAS